MNKVILTGRLTKDPELRKTNSDIAVTQFTIAVNRRFVGQDGQRQADFINCVAWRQAAENLCKYMRKGSLIGVEGQIQTRTYTDQNGQTRYITEVICDNIEFLETKSARENGYKDVNNYDIPEDRTQKQNSVDPFADLRSDDTNDDSSSDPFASLKLSGEVSNDDLPF